MCADGERGTTGIANLGPPCHKHHRLKHGSAQTPTGASKDDPPGWISLSGRHYPREHQDWEPPHWPDHDQPTVTGLGPHLDAFPDHGFPWDPGTDPETDLPPDPLPDWHLFTAGHGWAAADIDAPSWPEPFEDPYPEYLLLQSA